MTDNELESRLARAFAHAAPDDVEGVLSQCETRNGAAIPMEAKRKKTIRNLMAACLALALVGGGGGLLYQQANAVASVVSLDVNPSMELRVNAREEVLSCDALNEEAREVLADMDSGADLEGEKLDEAVDAVVNSLIRCGYLGSGSSAILISVEDGNQNRAVKLQKELSASVNAVLGDQPVVAAVLNQTVEADPELKDQARENHISTGKAYLVRQVMEMNGTIKLNSTTAFEQFARLSVEELWDLLELEIKEIPIGKDAAAWETIQYAGIPVGTFQVRDEGSKRDESSANRNTLFITSEVKSKFGESPACYEVKLDRVTLGGVDYPVDAVYTVDAFTGEVLSGQKDILSTGTVGLISESMALDAAYGHMERSFAELNRKDAVAQFIRLELEAGRPEYKAEFYCGGWKFEYEINANTGTVVDWGREKDEVGVIGGGQISIGFATMYISEEEAKEAALTHAGVAEPDAIGLSVELDKEQPHPVYKIKFKAGGVEYEYQIDAGDGAVWNVETDQDH